MLTASSYAVRVVRAWPGVRNGQILDGLHPDRRKTLLRGGFVELVEPPPAPPAGPRRRKGAPDEERDLLGETGER